MDWGAELFQSVNKKEEKSKILLGEEEQNSMFHLKQQLVVLFHISE